MKNLITTRFLPSAVIHSRRCKPVTIATLLNSSILAIGRQSAQPAAAKVVSFQCPWIISLTITTLQRDNLHDWVSVVIKPIFGEGESDLEEPKGGDLDKGGAAPPYCHESLCH